MRRRRTTLQSLPAELITDIALLLDLPSAKSLALVCRVCRLPTEKRIWQHVNLTVDTRAYEPSDHLPGGLSLLKSEEMYGLAVCERTRRVKSRSSPQRLAQVRRMTVIPRSGATHTIVELLEGAAASLTELRVEGRQYDEWEDGYRPDDLDMLDLRLSRRDIAFPALTHIRLDFHSIRFASFIPLLCQRAPNLTHLDLSVCQILSRSADICSEFKSPTKIQNLRLDCNWQTDPDGLQDAKTIMEIILFSPQLETLSVRYNSSFTIVDDYVARSLREHTGVRDFCWCDVDSQLRVFAAGAGTWTNLRRLVLHTTTWKTVFDDLPEVASLETLHIHHWTEGEEWESGVVFNLLEVPALDGFADPSPPTPMPSSFARHLGNSPRLRHINVLSGTVDRYDLDTFTRLDEIEASGRSTGYIRSIRHGDKELLHARMLLNHTWDLDKAVIDGIEVPAMLRGLMWFNAEEEALRRATFPGVPPAAWWDFTDYEGAVVPLSVIQRMREVQGGGGDWQARGIEVGEAAWKVLTDWKEEMDGS